MDGGTGVPSPDHDPTGQPASQPRPVPIWPQPGPVPPSGPPQSGPPYFGPPQSGPPAPLPGPPPAHPPAHPPVQQPYAQPPIWPAPPPGYGAPPSGPPGFGPPGFGPPGFGPPAAPRRRRYWPFLVSGGALVLVLVLVVGVVVGGSGGKHRTAAGPAASPAGPEADLSEAVDRLWNLPGIRYQGSVTDPTGARLTLDLRVASAGSVTGTVTAASDQAQIMATDGRTFLKADRLFWLAHKAPAKELERYSSSWVKIGPDLLGIDLSDYLGPQTLAATLAPQDFFDDATTTPVTTKVGTEQVGGVDTEVLDSSAGLRVYVTTARPHRIVRVTAAPQATPAAPGTGPSGTGRTALFPRPRSGPAGPAWRLVDDTGLQVDLTDMSPQEVDQFYTDLQNGISQLSTAVDAQVSFSLNGDVTLSPCTPNGCLANVTLSNKVTSSSRYLNVNAPVHASVTVSMTLDGQPIKTCTTTVTMPPNGTGTVTCQATYSIPPARNPTTHQVQAEVTAYAQALVQADLKRMADDLAQEIRQNRQQRPPDANPAPSAGGGSGPTSGPPPSGGGNASPYPCYQPTLGSSDGGPGAWATVKRRGGAWRQFQEQVTGVSANTEYKVARPGKTDVEFEGFRVDAGVPTFTEAKGYGYGGLLSGARFDDTGKLQIESRTAADKLAGMLNQIRSQLEVVGRTPGARLRYVVNEGSALDKIKAYAKDQLDATEFGAIDWAQQDRNWKFKGC